MVVTRVLCLSNANHSTAHKHTLNIMEVSVAGSKSLPGLPGPPRSAETVCCRRPIAHRSIWQVVYTSSQAKVLFLPGWCAHVGQAAAHTPQQSGQECVLKFKRREEQRVRRAVPQPLIVQRWR